MSLDPQEQRFEEQLPPRLVEELSRLHATEVRVPAALDRAILRQARQSFARRRRWWLAARWVGAAVASAAAIALAFGTFIRPGKTSSPLAIQPRPQIAQLADIDRDGRIDMLDAYLVGRKIARHEPLDPAWDINGDGVVDQKDVDLIAHLAVQVTLEGRR